MRKEIDAFLTAIVVMGSLLVVGILIAIVTQVVVLGLPEISWEFLATEAAAGGKTGGILNSIVATLLITFIGILIAAPLGVGSAVYLEEYSTSNRLNGIITMSVETMAGIPSIVYGLFGLVFFVIMLGWGWSILAGGCTLALMALPLIMRTSQEAIRAVSNEYRENSMALGASREQTLFRLVLPAAFPGILSGIVLSVGRIAGETAAVLLTAGSALGIPRSLFDTARPLPVHLYILASEGISMSKAYGTALVLIVLVLVFNFCVYRLRKILS
ncbi:MAG: Phosphate ABC transporter, inner membrane subunit PstA [Thermoanaerobacterales bacterium 50_218]|nr:MAG: Phosphate ABC transporter, inner membrane subunit PstA [Thermoanaerobacterales bacterium 50_218]HAA89318.1 phosphate ABC transporter permease PtsA [Peptococcaceae bacterium]